VKRFDEQDPYELLGVSRDAGPDEIRRAFERLSVLLAPGSLALYAAAEVEEQHELQRRLRAAYLELTGKAAPPSPPSPAAGTSSAAEDDQATLSEPETPAAPSAPPPAATAPIDGAAELSGARLRELREGAGISLRVMGERTRIRPQLLEYLEAEAWAALPPRVYVRGFVMAVARVLGLDPELAWAGYFRRWQAAQTGRP